MNVEGTPTKPVESELNREQKEENEEKLIKGNWVREVEDLADMRAAGSWFSSSYVNNLYIYPESVVMSSHNRKVKTIGLKVSLKDSDEDPQAAGLPVIYGKSSCAAFSTLTSAQAVYHNKTPTFHDEIKIKLPTQLTADHHLLFTFYHISCQKPKKGEDEVEVVTHLLSRIGILANSSFVF